jgi:hypothetical protein
MGVRRLRGPCNLRVLGACAFAHWMTWEEERERSVHRLSVRPVLRTLVELRLTREDLRRTKLVLAVSFAMLPTLSSLPASTSACWVTTNGSGNHMPHAGGDSAFMLSSASAKAMGRRAGCALVTRPEVRCSRFPA